MARPSVAAERREQIIEATLRTMAAHGVSGTTLDRIADAAGMSRGHVRHFVGNRDALLLDTARAVFSDANGDPAILPVDIETIDAALEYLFGEEFTTSDAENAVVLGLVELSRSNTDIAAVLAEAYTSTRRRLGEMLRAARPAADPDACAVVADGALSAALGNVFMGDFDADPVRTARTRAAIDALVAGL